MAISLKHLFQSAKTDGPDNTIVQPSDWNDEHVLTQATNRLLGRTTAGTGATEEIAPGTGITLSAGTLSADVTSVAGRTGAVTLSTADISGLTTGYVQKTSATGSAYLPAGTTGQREGSPAAGYIRYNTTTGKFEGYGSAWGNIGGGAAIGDTPPANPGAGDLWWNSADGRMYVYYTDANSSQWVDLSAGGAGQYLPLTGGDVTGNVTVTGNFGVGTLSPSSLNFIKSIQIAGAASTGIRATSTSGPSMEVGALGGSAYLTSVGAYPLILGTDNTERMRIDASGRVTMPYQPRFSGYGWPYQTHGAYSPTGTVITPTGSNLNDGSCWNFSTHRFTAPVSGKYRIFFTGMNTTVSGGYPLNVGARVNGSTIVASSYTNGGTAYNRSVLETFVSLSANDYVQFCIFEGGLHEGWGSANIELIG